MQINSLQLVSLSYPYFSAFTLGRSVTNRNQYHKNKTLPSYTIIGQHYIISDQCQTNKNIFFSQLYLYSKNIESFIYPTDAQLDCSKNVKIYMRRVATCFGFSHPSSGSYYMCFAKVISINKQLKYVVYRISSVYIELTGVERFNLSGR